MKESGCSPSGAQIQTMRLRGWRAVAARACEWMSKLGKANETPAAFKKRLRLNEFKALFPNLFEEKEIALHDLVHQRPQSVTSVADVANDPLDFWLINRRRRRAGSVFYELQRQ